MLVGDLSCPISPYFKVPFNLKSTWQYILPIAAHGEVQLANERITFRDLDIIQHFLADNGPDAQMPSYGSYGDEARSSNSTGWWFGT